MENAICRLPDAEFEVMQAVWDCPPPVSRADIERVLCRRRKMAATTILTLLSRLAERGALSVDKQGKSNVYTPVFSRGEYLAAQSRRFLKKLCGGDINVFAAALCDSGLSRDEIEKLRCLLERGEL
ncbi:MAG: BlaI/MecI/CopY family transcriptional regulator [Clostridiales bacterium]|jgi:BlaI family penicillinase repressor|nr:BlaI/MecI/CopY family transcriptional regulator [Clostridiales bacterium]